jgi:hypothetical protein
MLLDGGGGGGCARLRTPICTLVLNMQVHMGRKKTHPIRLLQALPPNPASHTQRRSESLHTLCSNSSMQSALEKQAVFKQLTRGQACVMEGRESPADVHVCAHHHMGW